MTYKQIISYLLFVSLIAGCDTVPVIKEDLGKYKPVQLEEASVKLSSKQLEAVKKGEGRIKVAVAKFTVPEDQSSIDYRVARAANLTQYAASAVNDMAVKAGAALVSGEDANKIKVHIQDAEKRGKGNGRYKGVEGVDIAILGEINAASFSASKTSGNTGGILDTTISVISGKKGSSDSQEKPMCKYEASVSGTLAVYRLPETSRTRSVNLQGTASNTVDGVCNGDFQPQLIKQAMDKAVLNAKVDFQDVLVVSTYVLEKRVWEGKTIFSISAGENLGLKPGTEIEFFNLRERTDVLTNKVSYDEIMVGKGRITDMVQTDRAWVLVDADDDTGIRLWDVARTHYIDCKELKNKVQFECIKGGGILIPW